MIMLGKKKGKKDPFNIIENPLSMERLSLISSQAEIMENEILRNVTQWESFPFILSTRNKRVAEQSTGSQSNLHWLSERKYSCVMNIHDKGCEKIMLK